MSLFFFLTSGFLSEFDRNPAIAYLVYHSWVPFSSQIAFNLSTYSSNFFLLNCERFPFHKRYGAFAFSSAIRRSFCSPIRKYASASSTVREYFSQIRTSYFPTSHTPVDPNPPLSGSSIFSTSLNSISG